MLKETFIQAAQPYSTDPELILQLWTEIEKAYTSPQRHYHNLNHLQFLLNQLNGVKHLINEWDVVLFSVFYHDIVYNTVSADNEEQSAAIAASRLQAIHFPESKIQDCTAQILATKNHTASNDDDTNLFIDADLSILGSDWPAYNNYTKQIRLEYAQYPDAVYKQGRKKVLQHFLQMQHIYKTAPFFDRYEKQARKNLEKEVQLLM